jgi:cyclophilin family peptidyl-prolyl cis-trans isomerase/HEAT repeat protein
MIASLTACSGGDKQARGPSSPPVSIADLELRGERAIGDLTAVARDAGHAQRGAAIRALGRVGDDRAVTALVDLAGDGDVEIRRAAAEALGVAAQLGATGAAIAAALAARWDVESEPPIKRALAIALGRSGDAAAIAPLVAGLDDASSDVVGAAALGLGLLGRKQVGLDDAARRGLVKLAGGAAHRYAATYALAHEHQPPVDPVVLRVLEALVTDLDPEVRALALTGLSRRRRGRARFAAALSDSDWRVVTAAITGLSELKSDAATGDLARWLRDLDPDEVDATVVRAALRVLVDQADVPAARSAARALRNKLADKAGADLDRSQIDCLARAVETRLGQISGVTQCGDAAPLWWRRSLAAEALATARLPAADRLRLLEPLLADGDARVRAAAIAAVVKLAAATEIRERVIAAIARALGDDSVAVAGTAADSVAALSLEGGAAAPLHQALVKRADRELDGDAELGLTLVAAIAANEIAAGIDACRKAHGHRNRAARRAGRECLAALTGKDPGSGDPAPASPPPYRPEPTDGLLEWKVETSRGALVIALRPDVAPWHVAAITGLSNKGFYDGLIFHRVVPGFVTQGGDPTGTGWGGPDFVLPPEPSSGAYDRGVVGIADAGPGTGGSQWFVTHARAPHLEGRYTIVGEVVSGIEVVDRLTVGDRIVSARVLVTIVSPKSAPR